MFDPLTDSRREFLARALMDMVKFVVAGGLATGFFATFDPSIKMVLVAIAVCIFVLAWCLFPPRGK